MNRLSACAGIVLAAGLAAGCEDHKPDKDRLPKPKAAAGQTLARLQPERIAELTRAARAAVRPGSAARRRS